MTGLHRNRLAYFLIHPARTSMESDICDLSNISDMKICIVGNGNIHIFKHPAYFSKDLWKIYISKKVIRYGDLTYIETFMDPIRMIQIINVFHQLLILSPT